MASMHINYLSIFVAAIAQFAVSGLWYSPVLFAKPWTALAGISQGQMQKANMPFLFGTAFLGELVTCFVLANILGFSGSHTFLEGGLTGLFCWLGFAGATSHATYMFTGKPHKLWLIDSCNNLVAFIIAGGILAVWK